MRRFIAIGLLLITLVLPSYAQDTSIICDDGSRYQQQIALTLPPINDETFEFIITALNIADYDPILAITAEDGFVFCNAGDDLAALYTLNLPTAGEIVGGVTSAQSFAYDLGLNTISIVEAENQRGTTAIFIEGEFIPEATQDHTFTLTLTPDMLASGETLTAYLFSLQDSYTPTLTLTTPEATINAQAVTDDIALFTPFTGSSIAVRAELPNTVGDVDLTVGRGAGAYALVLLLSTGEALPAGGIARTETTEDGRLALYCDDQLVSENAIRLTLPDTYTVTALSSIDIDPLLAIDGYCHDDSTAAADYTLNLPSVALDANATSVQATGQEIIIASRDSIAGTLALILEGGTITTESDLLTVDVSLGMVTAFDYVTAYAIATDNDLDTTLAWVDASGVVMTDIDENLMQCDDAGTRSCPPSSTGLRDFTVDLAGQTLPAFDFDSWLQIPMDASLFEQQLFLSVTGSNETSGGYIVVLQIVTD